VAAIQNKIVAVDAKIASDLLAKKNKRENISMLLKS
jgi:hypothetical protein